MSQTTIISLSANLFITFSRCVNYDTRSQTSQVCKIYTLCWLICCWNTMVCMYSPELNFCIGAVRILINTDCNPSRFYAIHSTASSVEMPFVAKTPYPLKYSTFQKNESLKLSKAIRSTKPICSVAPKQRITLIPLLMKSLRESCPLLLCSAETFHFSNGIQEKTQSF